MKKIIVFFVLIATFFSCAEDEAGNFSGRFGSFLDSRDGHQYKWVNINGQIWMAENLAYLPAINNNSGYVVYNYAGTNVTEAKSTENYQKYGVLYFGSVASEACPAGWHLPADQEWEQLAEFVSEDYGVCYKIDDYDWGGVGIHLKSTSGWFGDGNGTDDYGFNALPSGVYNEPTYPTGKSCFWWCQTTSEYRTKFQRGLLYDSNILYNNPKTDTHPVSIRCIKD